MEWQTVFRTFNPAEAQLVRSRLEAAQFVVNVLNELAALSVEGYSMAVGGIQVQVPADCAHEARALLNAPPDELA
jgi:hypothetical protein